MYLDSPQLSGAVAPVKQGSLGPSCGVTSGPATSKWCGATVIGKLSFDLTLNSNIK